MYLYQIARIGESHIACRQPVPPECSRKDALAYARKLATDCVVELWVGNHMLASYGPELLIAPVFAERCDAGPDVCCVETESAARC